MAAPALAVDKDAVKTHAQRYGIREAARAFELSENTVKSWSNREGWLADAGKTVCIQPLPESIQPIAPIAPKSASEADKYSVEKLKHRSRFRLAKALDKGSAAAARKSGDTVFAQAGNLAQLAQTHAKLFPEQQGQQSSPLLLLSISGCPSVTVQEGPAPTE